MLIHRNRTYSDEMQVIDKCRMKKKKFSFILAYMEPLGSNMNFNKKKKEEEEQKKKIQVNSLTFEVSKPNSIFFIILIKIPYKVVIY